MTLALRSTAACLVAVCLGGCAVGDASPRVTLPPMTAQRSATPVPPLALVADSGLSGLDQYPTMLWLLTASGVLDQIDGRPATILAPSETAFRDFAVLDRYGLVANPVAAAPMLRRHVVIGAYDADELVAAGTVTNLAGEQLAVWRNGRVLMVNEAALTPTAADDAARLIVYGTDRLLLFPEGSG